jgi:hypothetical protein
MGFYLLKNKFNTYNKIKMDKFDLKKYLAENKLNETSNSNLSAVEWLIEQIKNEKYIEDIDFQQAKEMEKQQIENAFNYGQFDLGMEADEYYKQTFKSE